MKVYLSHSIRGPKGKDATHVEMRKNCDRAIFIGKFIRKMLPSIELYIPGESEFFVDTAYTMGLLTIEQILQIDCKIIDDCDAAIFFLPPDDCELQGGRLVEYLHAIDTYKSVCKFGYACEAVNWLTQFIMRA